MAGPLSALAIAACSFSTANGGLPAAHTPLNKRSAMLPRASLRLESPGEEEKAPDSFSEQLLKMPVLKDAKRAAFDAFRERRRRQTAGYQSGAEEVGVQEVPLEEDPDGSLLASAAKWAAADEGQLTEDTRVEVELRLEDDEESIEVDLDKDDFTATDTYLDNL